MKLVNKSHPAVYVSVVSEAMQWVCTRYTHFGQAVNVYGVTIYVLRNYRLATWMSGNNNGNSPAHLLLLTVDTRVFVVLHIFMVFTKGSMITNRGWTIYNWKSTTVLSTAQNNNETRITGRSSDGILTFDKSCRERGYEIIDCLNFVQRSVFRMKVTT